MYLPRTTTNIEHFLAPLEEVIRGLLLATTGQSVFDDTLRKLIGLQARLGGLILVDHSQQGSAHYENSESITRLPESATLDQARECSPDIIEA